MEQEKNLQELAEQLVEENRNKEWQYKENNELKKIRLCDMPTEWLKKIRTIVLSKAGKRRNYWIGPITLELEYRYLRDKGLVNLEEEVNTAL